MGLFDKLFKPTKQDNFQALLCEQSQWTFKGLELLEKYMQTNDPAIAQEVHKAETEADECRRILIDELNRTFVTPIDREDIFSLSRAIDDIVDYADTTVDEMAVLKVEPNTYLIRMSSLLREAGFEISQAVKQLEDHPGVANEHSQRAKALENRVERVYREAIADLFHGRADSKQIVKMLKLREVYRHLSNASDRGDEAANIISDIVVKIGF